MSGETGGTPDSQKQNPSDKHHYIPKFYTKRWTSEKDGQLDVYEKTERGVNVRRGSPKSAGWARRLYTMHGVPEEMKSHFEEHFFAPADRKAANALHLLEEGKEVYDETLRSAWSRFLMGLLLRCPEDMEVFREGWDKYLLQTTPEIEEQYQKQRAESDPPTLSEMINKRSEGEAQQAMFKAYRGLFDHKNVGTHLNNMVWEVLDMSGLSYSLLTSDRPIVRTQSLRQEGGHICLPLSPTKLFVAANDELTIRAFMRGDRPKLVKAINQDVVGGAVKFVFAVDRKQSQFIRNRIGRSPQYRILKGIFERKQVLTIT